VTATQQEHPATSRPPLWRDATVVKWVAQIFALVVVLGVLIFLVGQAKSSLNDNGIRTGFDFINTKPGFLLGEGIDTDPATGGRALWVGMVNMFRLTFVGIIFATILGVIVGLGRLSKNWMVNKVSTVFVETIRNIPLLVQIIFYDAVITEFPGVEVNSGPISGWFIITQKGVSMPRIFAADGFYQWAAVMIIGLVVAKFVHDRRVIRRDETGHDTKPVFSAIGTIMAFALIGLVIHPLFGFLGPVFGALARITGGIPEVAVQIALIALAVAGSALWIRRFWNSFSGPAGRARLTDDDWFRMIFAAIGGLLLSALVVIWPGLSAWIVHSGHDLFRMLEAKFEFGNWSRPLDAMRPEVIKPGKFTSFGPSGLTMSKAFAAVFMGVVLYTASFIAEVVRGGILAVPKGQLEAADAVGLTKGQSLRHIVLPQAFRVILPPMGNQYLNLAKNTTLAIAVGYADLVQVGQTLYNQSGKTIEVMAIWMLFYLAVSLSLSSVVNFWNVRLKLVER